MKAVSLVLVLIFFGIIASAAILETAAVMKLFDGNREDFRERETIKAVLDEIVHSFNDLVALDADYEQNPVLESIRYRYAEYDLIISDISSGFNLNFLPDIELNERGIAAFLFATGNAESFLGFRRSRGFVTDIAQWSAFLKEEALEAVVCYGWFSSHHKNTNTGRMVAISYGSTVEELFPLINDLPLINVNSVNTVILAPLLLRPSWRISNAAARVTALTNRLEQGPVTEAELQSLLRLQDNHDIFRYLGVRTTFWGLSFKKDRYRMDAVIAAVPEKGSKNIDYYTLIEGKLSREI